MKRGLKVMSVEEDETNIKKEKQERKEKLRKTGQPRKPQEKHAEEIWKGCSEERSVEDMSVKATKMERGGR